MDGEVYSARNAGASVSVPSLPMATPWLVPLSNSSYLVCSQVRVPWAQHIAASNGQKSASRSTFIMSPDWPIGRNKKSVTQREQTVGSGVGVQHGTHRSTLRGRPRFQAFSNKLRLFSRAPISQAIVTAEDYLRYGDFSTAMWKC